MSVRFVSWTRRGVAAGDHDAIVASRRTVRIPDIVVEPGDGVPVTTAPLALFGPGDVLGIETRQVVRRCPRPDDQQLEPNYLAAIEFAHPDLPWLFSPAAARVEALQPWLMLIVIADGQGRVDPGSPNEVLTVGDPAALPAPADAWAFAHVQVHDAADDAAAAALVERPDGAVRSRLLCPTRLREGTSYTACVVPVYEAGRRVGLGGDEGDAGVAMWTPAVGLRLPVYDRWRFRTGPTGDFETLARLLHQLDPAQLHELGERSVAVEAKAALLQPDDDAPELFAPAVHAVPTAIRRIPAAGESSPLAPGSAHPQAAALHGRLKELLDIVASADDAAPIVGPPIYGRWPAEVTSLDDAPETAGLTPVAPGTAQTWIAELNADPLQRIAAGVATKVVQRDQEKLMREAWAQLSEVIAANRRIRWAETFAVSATRVHDRLAQLDELAALRVASPAAGRLRATEEVTYRGVVDRSTLPASVVGAAFARTARFVVKRTAAVANTAVTTRAAELLAANTVELLPARFRSLDLDPDVVGRVFEEPIFSGVAESLGRPVAERIGELESVTTLATAAIDRAVPDDAGPQAGRVNVRFHPEERQRAIQLSQFVMSSGELHDEGVVAELQEFMAGQSTTLSAVSVTRINEIAASIADAPVPLDLAAAGVQFELTATPSESLRTAAASSGLSAEQTRVVAGFGALSEATLSSIGVTANPMSDVLGALVADDMAKVVGATAREEVVARGTTVALDAAGPLAAGTAGRLVADLEPRAAYGKLLAYAHGEVGDVVRRRHPAYVQFSPVMAAPRFRQPMVERLKSFDRNWLLGGVDRMAPNSVCLLQINWTFVEAFLAGANAEIARELLWRGYPTDFRGTCFDRFWPSAAANIAPVHHWLGTLGEQGPDGPRRKLTLLVIKGDLLRRYPSTLITAEHGTASLKPDPDDPQGQPFNDFVGDGGRIATEVFRDFIEPDVTYSALDIDPELLRTDVDPANPLHCWYISLLEPHDEPRFGLDETAQDQVADANRSTRQGGVDARDYKISDGWSWQGLPGGEPAHLAPGQVFADDSSAVVGASLFQRPFRVLLRAPEYLGQE